MNAQQKKAKKRKDREKKSREKVLKIRENMRKSRKAAQLQEMREKEAHAIVHGKQMPFIKNPLKLAEREAALANKAKSQLEKNMEILQALELEYEQEQAIRAHMNEKLESEGHKSLKEKMNALHEKALKLEGKAEQLVEAKEKYVEELKNYEK